MNTLMQTFRSVIRALQGAIGDVVHKIRPEPVLLVAGYHYISRAANRLNILFDRWKAGTLPKLRPSRAGKERKPSEKPRLRFPSKFGWLGMQTDYQVRGQAVQLELVINQPEFVEFFNEVPRAARLFRPLRHMLGIQVVPAVIGPYYYAKPPRRQRPQPPQVLPPPIPPSFTPPNYEVVTGTRIPFAQLPNHGERKAWK